MTKKIMAIGLWVALSLGLTPLQIQKTDRAEAGVASLGLLFFIDSYANGVDNACRRTVRGDLGGFFFCFWGWVFGDHDQSSQESMKWMSSDHPAVKTGLKTRSGEVVKFSEAERRAHNDQLDLYIEIVQKISKELENVSIKSELSPEALKAFSASKVEELSNKISREVAKTLETETEISALEKFLKLRFGFSIRK